MKKILLIIDCQKAFINNYTKEYVNKIKELLNTKNYSNVVFTIFKNNNKSAFDLFENNIKAYILQDYCMSSGGEKYHYEAIDILKRSIGEKFII